MEEQEHQSTEDQTKPELLFHYTRQKGLDGILKDKCIWATHYRFLNDSTERQHGLALYKRVISSVAIKQFGSVESAKTLVEYLQRSYSDIFDTYIVCFSTSYSKEDYKKKRQSGDWTGGDRLSQWRGYAPGSQGYCLAFDFQLVQQIQQLPQNRKCSYYGFCMYTEESKRQLVETHVNEIFESHFRGLSVKDLKSPESLHEALMQNQPKIDRRTEFAFDMLSLCGILKHDGFQEENEYRLIKFMFQSKPNSDKVCFRPDNTPYIEHRINLAAANSPLRAIFVGPSANTDHAAYGLQLRLNEMGLSHVKVIPSDIPYRG